LLGTEHGEESQAYLSAELMKGRTLFEKMREFLGGLSSFLFVATIQGIVMQGCAMFR